MAVDVAGVTFRISYDGLDGRRASPFALAHDQKPISSTSKVRDAELLADFNGGRNLDFPVTWYR